MPSILDNIRNQVNNNNNTTTTPTPEHIVKHASRNFQNAVGYTSGHRLIDSVKNVGSSLTDYASDNPKIALGAGLIGAGVAAKKYLSRPKGH